MSRNFCFISILLCFFSGLSFSQERVTARYYYSFADSIARSLIAEPCLIIIRNDSIDLFGKAENWDYAYQELKISFKADTVLIDTTFGEWTGSNCVKKDWFDSDSALCIAEQNGGAQFRQLHPNSQILMDLGHDSASPWTEWMIQYSSKSDSIHKYIILDAHTGEIIYNYTTSVMEQKKPFGYTLYQNYPNPFNPLTTIGYQLPEAGLVALKIYNLQGKLVRTLVQSEQSATRHQVVWDSRDEAGLQVAAGIYLCQMQAGAFTETLRLVLLK